MRIIMETHRLKNMQIMFRRCRCRPRLIVSLFRSFTSSSTPSTLSSAAIEISTDLQHGVNLIVPAKSGNQDEPKQAETIQIEQFSNHQVTKQQKKTEHRTSFSQVQLGVASIVAESFLDSTSTEKTHLTTISHKAPARVIPLLSSPVASAGAAVVVVSNYGGGLLPGDELQYNMLCRPNAKIAVMTQGSNRIYKQPQIMDDIDNSGSTAHDKPSRSVINLSVEQRGTVIVAPDPVSVFTDAVYQQDQTINFEYSSSFCIIDWISSGRYLSGERWQQRSLKATTSVYYRDNKSDPTIPVLVDSIEMRRGGTDALPHKISDTWGMDGWSHNSTTNGHPWNAFASMLIYGDQMQRVIQACEQVQLSLVEPFARVRRQCSSIESNEVKLDSSSRSNNERSFFALSGRVTMGISEIPLNCQAQHKNSSLFAVRFAAMSNEDLYRVFHTCLLPLKGKIGVEFYKDRIRASSCNNLVSTTAIKTNDNNNPYDIQTRAVVGSTSNFDLARMRNKSKHPLAADNQPIFTEQESIPKDQGIIYWKALMLSDSALPTGSFAHSSGLEAISQLGIISAPEDISLFIQIATKSALQQAVPFILGIHLLFNQLMTQHSSLDQQQQIDEFCRLWLLLDNHAHARLVSNSPACRASLDQGGSLFRVASHLMVGQNLTFDTELTSEIVTRIAQEIQVSTPTQTVGHMASVLGIVTAILRLNAKDCCQLLGYCVARDMVSAAVRMNLLGPLASVSVLSNAQQAADEGYYLSVSSKAAVADTHPLPIDFDTKKRIMLDQIRHSSSCAPLFDSIQPCHEVLSSRMFRS